MTVTSNSAAPPAKRRPDWLSLLEWLTSGGIVCAVVFLSAVSALHAGGFWRDEANSIQLAMWPGFRENWNVVRLDAHPVGYSMLLKPVVALAGGQPAGWLRWVGAGIYLLIVGTLWLFCRQYSGRAPLLFFAAITLNPLSIRFLSNLRPYGLVTWLLLLCLFAATTYARKGGRWPLVVVGLTAFLCVQCLYASTPPLLCIVSGAVWWTWRLRGRRAAAYLALVGAIAASTVVIYLPGLIKARYWADLQSYRTPQLAPFWGAFTDLLGSGGTSIIWMWALALPSGVALYFWNRRRTNESDSRISNALLPISYASLLGVICLLVFGRTFTAQWYFLPAMFLVAAALEVNFVRAAGNSARNRLIYIGLTIIYCFVQMPAANSLVKYRQTTIDVIARDIARQATAQDFVVVTNPFHGVSFNLYYRGAAPWETIPPLADHRIHRFDLFRDQINNPDAVKPLLQKIEVALKGGHRVFLVGGIKANNIKADPKRALDIDAFATRWHTQVALFLAQHAGDAKYRNVNGLDPILGLEAPELIVVRGWR